MIIIFSILGLLAIVSGGLLSAFTARKPTRRWSWLSAYLVLVAGVMQLGLVAALHGLGHFRNTAALLGLLLYNLGNIGVMAGTALKTSIRSYHLLVNAGGLCLALAMVLLLLAVRQAPVTIALIGFVALVLIILVSTSIGLLLSAKRR